MTDESEFEAVQLDRDVITEHIQKLDAVSNIGTYVDWLLAILGEDDDSIGEIGAVAYAMSRHMATLFVAMTGIIAGRAAKHNYDPDLFEASLRDGFMLLLDEQYKSRDKFVSQMAANPGVTTTH